jgi:hypothetical protein
MNSVENFAELFTEKDNKFLISVLKERASYHTNAVIAAGKMLSERGVDLQSIRDQIESQENNSADALLYIPEEVEENPSYEKYKEEIELRMQNGMDPEAIRLSLKEKGYNGFDMIEQSVNQEEKLNGKKINWQTWLTVIGIIGIILKVIKLML